MSCEHCKAGANVDCPACKSKRMQVLGTDGESWIYKCCKCRQKQPIVNLDGRKVGVPWGGEVPFDRRD